MVVGLHLAAPYTALRRFLDLEPLRAGDLALCIALAAGLLAVLEVAKAGRRADRQGSESAPYAFEWGERVRMRDGRGRQGQVTPPAGRSVPATFASSVR